MRILGSLTPRRLSAHATIVVLMDNTIRAGRRPWRPGSPAARTAAAVIATAFVALLVAACAGSSSSTGFGGSSNAEAPTSSPSAIAYSSCMRSHGVRNFPDPESSGQLPKASAQQLGVSSSQLQAARQVCQRTLPNNGGAINAGSIDQCMMADDCPQALVQQVLTEERNFARCMRSSGVPNWPDPTIDSQGRPVFAISISKDGFDPYSRQIWAKGNDCSRLMPGLPGLPAAVSP
jgi:hypothetical protein